MDLAFFFAMPSAILLAIIQSTAMTRIHLFGASPDVVLLFVVSWALQRGAKEGVLVALAGGMVLDALSGASFGLGTASLLIVGLLAGWGETNAFRTASYVPFVAVGLATLIYYAFFAMLLRLSGESFFVGMTLGRVILPAVLVNALFILPVYGLVRLVTRRRMAESVEWQ